MKVLHVYKDYYPPVKGGIENHLNVLCNGLKDRGVDVKVLVSNTCNNFETENINGITVAKTPQLGRFYSAPIAPVFSKYLKIYGKHADIIHFHHPNPTAEISYFFTKLCNKKKLIITYHSDIIRQDKLAMFYSPFRKRLLQKADRIIATSPNYIQSSTILNKFKSKCSIIPLGIDTSRFHANDDNKKIEQIRNKYPGRQIILFVGRFRYYKGLHILIAAMDKIDAQLLLIGNGPEYARLRHLVDVYKLNVKIKFLGGLPDDEVTAYYKACDIFVLPSHLRSEAFGLVQLEAMSCGKPVISTELKTGTSFVNIHNKTGLTVNPDNVIELTNAIQYLLQNPEIRKGMGQSGLDRTMHLFSADKMVDSILNLYHEVLEKKKKKGFISVKQDIKHDQDKRRIKIVRVVSRLNIGGPTIHIKNLTEGLAQNKFETRLITGTISPDEGDMSYITNFKENTRISIPELQREIDLFKDTIALFKLYNIINLIKPDIIHSHTSKAGTLSRLAALFCNIYLHKKIITIHTFHGNVLYGYFSRLKTFLILNVERFLANFTTSIIAISESQKKELSEFYRICDANKIKTIKLGFELTPFINCVKQKGRLRKKLSLTEDVLLVGIVGRMAPIKNHKMFLDAAKLVVEQCMVRNIKFILVGDGELRTSLERYVCDIGLQEHVIFHGWEKDIPMVYADLDILALTSLNEGTPVSIIEAMSAKVPVLTTGVGGVKDLLGNIESVQPESAAFKVCKRGILCPKEDPHAFFSALKYMMESNYLSNKKRFLNAQDYVVRNYSVYRLIEEMESLYENLLSEN